MSKSIGRYQIKEELGRGGMATVYLAYDPVLERDVALKLLPNYFAHDPEFFARFEREAKTVAALEHAAIVSMYDYGEDGEWPYFVMRLMTGGDLKGKITQGPLSLEEAAQILGRIGAALDKAHSRGIVHRDLKPGNILFDADGEAYLSDFGIVKIAEASESYTRTGNTLGTPQYMSPEQLDGLPDIDGRTDVYALGVILYEMLSGVKPYDHESLPRIMVMHLNHPIPDILEANPNLPPEVGAIIHKAMAKNRDDRYARASELATAVKAIAAAQTGATAPAATAVTAVSTPAPEPETSVKPEPVAAAAVAASLAPEKPAEPAASTAVAAEPTPAPVTQPPPTATAVPAPQPEPAKPTPPPPAPAKAKSGGIPKWAYAVIGLVSLIAIVAIAALFSGEPSDTGGSGSAATTSGAPAAAAVVDTATEESAVIMPEEPVDIAPVAEGEQTSVETFDRQGDWAIFTYEDDDGFVYGQSWVDAGALWVYSDSFDFICSRDMGSVYGEGYYQVEATAVEGDFSQGKSYGIRFDSDAETSRLILVDPGGWLWIGEQSLPDNTYWDYFEESWLDIEQQGLPLNHEPGQVNTLGVLIAGGEMTLFLNDAPFGPLNSDFTEGSICLGGGWISEDASQGFLVAFDNFSYTPAR